MLQLPLIPVRGFESSLSQGEWFFLLRKDLLVLHPGHVQALQFIPSLMDGTIKSYKSFIYLFIYNLPRLLGVVLFSVAQNAGHSEMGPYQKPEFVLNKELLLAISFQNSCWFENVDIHILILVLNQVRGNGNDLTDLFCWSLCCACFPPTL